MTTIHMIGLPHTIVSNEYSHCAFTGKILRFPKMMQTLENYGDFSKPYTIHEYSNEGSESLADIKTTVFTKEQMEELKADHKKNYPGIPCHVESKMVTEYHKLLTLKLCMTVEPGDIICHPFGNIHSQLAVLFPQAYHLESGIGYNDSWAPFRVFESYAWWHYHQGKEGRAGTNYEWVIPNYYDLDEWGPNHVVPGDAPIVYFGRIMENKGMPIIQEIAKAMPNEQFVICGEGDPNPWLSPDIPNLTFIPPIYGLARRDFLANAKACLMPTMYTEPFGGAGVEAMLCGTPLISSDFGAFSETNPYPRFRCKTLKQWVDAITWVSVLNYHGVMSLRERTAWETSTRYCLEAIAPKYDAVFKQILDLKGKGWYTL